MSAINRSLEWATRHKSLLFLEADANPVLSPTGAHLSPPMSPAALQR